MDTVWSDLANSNPEFAQNWLKERNVHFVAKGWNAPNNLNASLKLTKTVKNQNKGEIENYSRLEMESWIFSWAMSHICVNDEYRSQVGATNRPENIVIRYVSFVS
jgi:hypothetical protein